MSHLQSTLREAGTWVHGPGSGHLAGEGIAFPTTEPKQTRIPPYKRQHTLREMRRMSR